MRKILIASFMAWLLPHASNAAPFGYITNFNDGTVSVFDAQNNTVIDTIPVGINPYGVSIHPNGTFAYITNLFGPEEVKVIDTSDNSIVTGIPVGNNPLNLAMHPQGSFLYVTTVNNNGVSVIDLQTNSLVGPPITVGTAPQGIAISPDGSALYVANSSDATVSVIDTATLLVVDTINVGNGPFGLMVNPSGDRLYVTNNSDSSVSVIDTADNGVITTIPVASDPESIAIHPDGQSLFITHSSSMAPLTIVNAQSNAVSSTIPNLGDECHGISIHPNSTLLYVACAFPTGEVVVIDIAGQSIADRITVGGSPFAFGQFITPLALLQLSTTSLTFGEQPINSSSQAQILTLTNTGNLGLNLSSIDITGDFNLTSDCPDVLEPGESCNLTVIFFPESTGNLAGTITIASNDPASPSLVSLSGIGVSAALISGAGCGLIPVAPHEGLVGASLLATLLLLPFLFIRLRESR